MSPMIQTFPLGTDAQLPAVGFGTYLIGEAEAASAVSTAIGVGYRHIDTAAVYENETAVGAGLRQAMIDHGLNRDSLFVTTKLWPGVAEWGQVAVSEAQTIVEFEASLDRLGLDYVDLYLIHSPHAGEERLGQWRALLKLKALGKARNIGVSNYNRAHLEEIAAAGLPLPDANQIELHPWSQKRELVAFMREHGIAPIAYSSLAPLSTWRTAPGQDSGKTDAMKADDGVFLRMASEYGVTEAQLLLRWGVQNGYAILPKSLNPERMRQNLDLADFSITEDDMALLGAMDRGDGIAWSVGDPTKVG